MEVPTIRKPCISHILTAGIFLVALCFAAATSLPAFAASSGGGGGGGPGSGTPKCRDGWTYNKKKGVCGQASLIDRITHHVHILEMNRDSYRLKQKRSRNKAKAS